MGIRQNLYEAVYNALLDGGLLNDTVKVTSAYTDETKAFPQVVVHPVDVDKAGFTFDRSYSTKNIRLMIDIWTYKNKDKDEIADEIDDLLGANILAGISLVGWTESNALEPQGGNKIHLKTIVLDFVGG